ncbi:mechanosensitive ion channel [soil metagenome]
MDSLTFVGDLSSFEVRAIETAGLVLVLVIVRELLMLIVRGQTDDARVRYHWSKGITYAVVVLGVFGIGRVWFVGLGSIATFVGLFGAGLVIALKEPVSNFAAWGFMLWRRPFVIGDRIEIGAHAGDVIDQTLLEFSILEIGNWVQSDQSTGRVIHIPNGRLWVEPVANYTRGFPYLWNEIDTVITFESNWRRAKELLLTIAERHGHELSGAAEQEVLTHSRRFMIFYSTLAPTVYTKATERGVMLTIRYLCEVRRRRDTEQAIWEGVLTAFAGEPDIDFAYPTRRFFDRAAEDRTLRGHASESGPDLAL